MQKDNNPAIILVAPQLALNVGMVARVMLNFSFTELRIVTPRDKDVISNALAASAGADYVLENSKIFGSLEDAVRDLNIVYATSKRVRDFDKPVVDLYNAFSENKSLLTNVADKKIGFLFGKEASGLSNNDLNYANILVTIDTNPSFSSLNLAQAVALLCYEWTRSKFKFSTANCNSLSLNGDSFNNNIAIIDKAINKRKVKPIATFADLEHFFSYLESNLAKKNFFTEDKKSIMVRNLRNVFLKNQLSRNEVRTLFSIVKALNNDL